MPNTIKVRNSKAEVQVPNIPEIAVAPRPLSSSFCTAYMPAGIIVIAVPIPIASPAKPRDKCKR